MFCPKGLFLAARLVWVRTQERAKNAFDFEIQFRKLRIDMLLQTILIIEKSI
jgi:hypothetical protein